MPFFPKEKFLVKHEMATLMSAFSGSKACPYRSLMYHSVFKTEKPRDIYSLHIDKMLQQMHFLKNKNWRFIRFDETPENKANQVSVTFDDGFEDNKTLAYPCLKEMGIPFTIFMISDFTKGQKGYLNSKDLRELAQDPLVTIGSHGKTHRPLASLPLQEAREEMRVSKIELEDILGREVTVMSFPHGSFNKALLHEAEELGYKKCGTSVALGNDEKVRIQVNRQCIFLPESTWSFSQKMKGKWDWLATAQ